LAQASGSSAQAMATIPVPGGTWSFVRGVARGIRAAKPYAFLREWHDQYGPLVRIETAVLKSVSVADAQMVKWVTRNDPARFEKGMGYESIKRGWLDNSLVVSEGEEWRRKRSVYNRAFKLGAIRSYVPLFVDIAEAAAVEWQHLHEKGQPVDAVKCFESVALESIGRAGFGVTGMGAPGNVYASAFVSYLDVLQDEMQPIMMLLPPGLRNYVTELRGRRHLGAMNAESRRISERRSPAAPAGGDGQTKQDLVSLMRAAAEEEGTELDPEQLAREANLFLFAGHDTTSATLAWLFSYLATHPEAQKRVHEEVSAVPAGSLASELSDPRSLPYLGAAIKETLRLSPPAPLVMRRSKFGEELGGHQIPAGTDLMLSIWCLHRDPNVFQGPDKFSPERWLEAGEEELKAMQDHWAPFMVGARSCIGQMFSLMEMRVVAATLLSRFSLEPASTPQIKQRMLLLPSNILLKCTPRSASAA